MKGLIASRNIPSLDGLRAISIALVIWGHLVGTRYFPVQNGTLITGELAHLGVQVFFVISGFLITTLLKNEIARTGSLSLRRFYLRRFFRIFPPFYVYVGLVALAVGLGWAQLNRGDLLAAFTYTINFHPQPAWLVGHIWSLSTEEQFYLFWPALIVVIAWRRAIVASALIMNFPLLRAGIVHFAPNLQAPLSYFPNGMDSIAAGCLLAGIHDHLGSSAWYTRLVESRFVWFLLALPVAHVLLANHARAVFVLGFVINVALAILIDRCMRLHSGPVGRFLNSAPMRWVGVLSYSIYLWQMPFLDRESSSAWCAFPVNIVLAGAAAIASYYLVERPFLAMRQAIEDALARRQAIGTARADAASAS